MAILPLITMFLYIIRASQTPCLYLNMPDIFVGAKRGFGEVYQMDLHSSIAILYS